MITRKRCRHVLFILKKCLTAYGQKLYSINTNQITLMETFLELLKDGDSVVGCRSRNSRPAPAKTDSNHHLAGSIEIIALQKSRFEITLSMKYFLM